MNLQKFTSQYIITDITTVKFIENYVFAGIGGYIHIFDIQTKKLICKEEAFKDQRVHNIIVAQNEDVAAIGGYKIQLFKIAKGGQPMILSKQQSWTVNDWIQHFHWLDCGHVALITAHNVLSLWNSKTGENLRSISCEEKCILYCALLEGSTWNNLLVFAGTVFQQVLVWAPASLEDNTVDSPVLHTLRGHNGVIFSISYNACSRHICTTSDDRSVRIWLVHMQSVDDSNYLSQWKNAKITVLHTMYGHSSRVWRNIIVDNAIVSVGEDSNLCIWNIDGSLRKCLKTHQGGNVWSVDYNKEKDLIVTGGGDGGISLWSLHTDKPSVTLLPFQDNLFREDSTNSVKGRTNFPRRICFLNNGNIVTVTDSGCLLHCTVLRKEWQLEYQNDKLANYCILEVSPCKKYIALATINGDILIFQAEENSMLQRKLSLVNEQEKVVKGRIFSLKWLSQEIILTCGPSGMLEIWKIDISYHLTKIREFELPKSKERWISAAFLKGDFLICGDRLGSVHLYSLNNGSQSNSVQCPSQSFHKIHGHLGVSSLAWYGSHLYSTGRDGTLRQYLLWEDDGRLEYLNADRIKMEWPATAVLSDFGLLVLGFKADNFMLWNHEQRCTLFSIPCGGGHRSWDWMLEGKSFSFIYLKDKMVHLYTSMLDITVKPAIQRGFHAKQVSSMKRVSLLKEESGSHNIFVSASEDTTVRVTTLESSNVLQTLVVLQSHISSVHAIAVCPLLDHFLVFSGGGRAQLKIWRLNIAEVNDHQLQVSYKELQSHMLRNPGKQNKKPWISIEYQIDDPETRYMDLCATVIHCENRSSEIATCLKGTTVLLAAGCSDGYLRIFGFDASVNELKLVGEYSFHKHCLLKVSFINTKNLKHIVLTMATDGKMAFWDMTTCIEELSSKHKPTERDRDVSPDKREETLINDLKPFSAFKLHQSGINSFDCLQLQDDIFLFATGGDDNALVLSVIKIISPLTPVGKMEAEILLQWRNDYAHTSQITGMVITDSVLISTGIDQCIKIWKWNCELGSQTLSAAVDSDYCSAVPDIQGLLTWNSSSNITACVYGKGLEILNIQLNKNAA